MRVWSLLTVLVPCAACVADAPPGRLDAHGNECPLTAPRGEVTLTLYETLGWVGMDVVGRFQRSVPARESIACTRRTVGACEVQDCRNVGVDFVNGEPTCGSTSAGALRVTRAGRVVTREDGSMRLTLDAPFTPGEVFSVRATGGDVPAFERDVVAPRRPTVTGPEALTRGGSLALRPGEGFAVTWTPTTSRVVVVVTSNNGGQRTIECSFDGGVGRGDVPGGVLPDDTASVSVVAEERRSLQAGAFPVSVLARQATDARASLIRAL